MKSTVYFSLNIILFSSITINSVNAQEQTSFKEIFLQELQSGDVEDGCKIVILVADIAANAACFVPEPTVSKVACAAAQIMNITSVNSYDPNSPNLVLDAGVRVCQLTYASSSAGIQYIFEFSENQAHEIRQTWN